MPVDWVLNTERDVWVVDTSEAVDGLKKLGEETEKTHKHAEGMADFLEHDLKRAVFSAEAAYDLLKESIHEVWEVMKEARQEYLASELGMSQLGVALRNAGYESKELTKIMEENALELARVSGVNKDHILGLQKMAITFGASAEQAERMVDISIQLAAANNMSADSLVRMLARAEENETDLKKLGIVVKDVKSGQDGFNKVLEIAEQRIKGMNDHLPESIRLTREFGANWAEIKEKLGKQEDNWLMTNFAAPIRLINDLMNDSVHAEWNLWTKDGLNKPILEFIKNASEAEKLKEALARKTPEKQGIDLGTLPAFDVTGEMAKQEEAYKKLQERSLKIGKETSEGLMKVIQQQIAEENAMRKEAGEQRLKDQKQEDEAELVLREYENDQAKAMQEAFEKFTIGSVERTSKVIKAAAVADAEIYKSLANSMEGYGKQMIGAFTGAAADALTADTQFSKGMRANAIGRATVGMTEMEAQKTRIAMQKRAEEAKIASLEEALAKTLSTIAIDAQVNAIMETAKAIASAAEYDYEGSAAHGVAAAAYGAVAIAAGGASIGLSQTRGMTQSEQDQLKAADQAAIDEANNRRAKQDAQRGTDTTDASVQVNVYHIGVSGMTTAAQGAELEKIKKDYEKTKTGGGGL